MTLDYIPYIGAACTTLILLGVGLVSFPSLGYALVPPAAFVGGDDRRPIYQSDRVGPSAHAQSAGNPAGALVLGVAVGSDGGIPSRAVNHRDTGLYKAYLPDCRDEA